MNPIIKLSFQHSELMVLMVGLPLGYSSPYTMTDRATKIKVRLGQLIYQGDIGKREQLSDQLFLSFNFIPTFSNSRKFQLIYFSLLNLRIYSKCIVSNKMFFFLFPQRGALGDMTVLRPTIMPAYIFMIYICLLLIYICLCFVVKMIIVTINLYLSLSPQRDALDDMTLHFFL